MAVTHPLLLLLGPTVLAIHLTAPHTLSLTAAWPSPVHPRFSRDGQSVGADMKLDNADRNVIAWMPFRMVAVSEPAGALKCIELLRGNAVCTK